MRPGPGAFWILLGPLVFLTSALGQESQLRVAAIWPDGPLAVRIAFDRPVPADLPRALTGRTIAFARGDVRSELAIAGARAEDDGRTLVLLTDPHSAQGVYTLDLPQPIGRRTYTLSGVEVSWTAEGADEPTWSGWWPDVDPSQVRKLLAGSASHARQFESLTRSGRLTLRSNLVRAAGPVRLTIVATVPFQATFGFADPVDSRPADGKHRAEVSENSTGEPLELALSPETGRSGQEPMSLTVEGVRSEAWLLPWAPAPFAEAPASPPPFRLTGGDAGRGRLVFTGDQAKCSACHAIGGQGGAIGPPLDGLAAAGRDAGWIYHQIAEPSARIHPGYVSFALARHDGRIHIGVIRAQGPDQLRVLDSDAKETIVPRAEVAEVKPSPTSVMPVGLTGALGEDQVRDLVAYLLRGGPGR